MLPKITLNLENYKEISGINDGFLEDFSRCLDDLIKLNIINYVGSINNNYLLYFHNNELWVVYDKNKEKYIALDLALKTLDDAMGKDSILVLSFYEEIIIEK